MRRCEPSYVEGSPQVPRCTASTRDGKAPWTTRKTDMVRTATTLYVCCQVVRALCTALVPFTPDGAAKLAGILGVSLPVGGPDSGDDGWNAAKEGLPAGTPLQQPEVLFPKLDPEVVEALAVEHAAGQAT